MIKRKSHIINLFFNLASSVFTGRISDLSLSTMNRALAEGSVRIANKEV